MADTTLLDIVIANAGDDVAGLILEGSKMTPEVTGMTFNPGGGMQQIANAARTITGLNYKTLVRTVVPTGSSFRQINEGVAYSKATRENRLVEVYTLNRRWRADKAAADRYEDGWQAYFAIEAMDQLAGASQDLGAQYFYGTNTTYSGQADGFPGLIDAYDSTNMVVDAGGTTATTGSSVWGVRWGSSDVTWVFGQNGMVDVSDVREETVTDSSSNDYTAYVQEILAYPGLQVGANHSIGRIKKLTADSGKGLTDDLVSDLIQKFLDQGAMPPDVLYMTPRSLSQLQQSRTATNTTGAPAPFPTESHGIPIAVTNSISNVEDLSL